MKANEYQVGGTHYQTDYQPWDLVLKLGLGYFEGTAIRYITRWRKKDGVQDLKKALHYVDKLIENIGMVESSPHLGGGDVNDEIRLFSKANDLSVNEDACVLDLVTWVNEHDLTLVRNGILCLIEEAKSLEAK